MYFSFPYQYWAFPTLYALSQISSIAIGNAPSKRSIGAGGRPCASLFSNASSIVYTSNVSRVVNGV